MVNIDNLMFLPPNPSVKNYASNEIAQTIYMFSFHKLKEKNNLLESILVFK